jgi:predicted Zn finger-like uncharacterized protein
MRFSCENCHAKYQVADEKVAGKTIRMKCRKCGNSIEVKPVLAAEASLAATEQHAAAPETRVGDGVGAQSVLGGAFPGPDGPPSRGPFDSSPGFDRAPDSLRLALGGPEGAELPAHFWYVAIGGAPVGPIALAEVIAKARDGAIHDRSLAWREGLPEWQPIGQLPELVEAIGPALQHAPPRSVAAIPVASVAMMPAAAPAAIPAPAPAPARAPVTPVSTVAAAAPKSAAKPVATASTLVASQMPDDVRALLDSTPNRASLGSSPEISVHDASIRGTRASVPDAAPISVVGAVAKAPASSGKAGVAFVSALVGVALGFGAGRATAPVAAPAPAAVVAPPVQAAPARSAEDERLDEVPLPPPVEKPRTPAPAPAAPAAAVAPKPAAAPVAAPTPAPAAPAPTPAPAAAPSAASQSMGAPPPPSMGPAFGGGSSLTEGQIAMVLSQRKIQLRRACWERIENHDSSVKVQATVNIEGSGRVSSVDATGTDAAVTACIRQQIKEWTFPATGAQTTATLPFSFVSQ